MFRYLYALILLNYCRLGVPIPLKGPVPIVDLLSALSIDCENRFISDQIKNKLVNCTGLSSPQIGKKLDCYLFYDINRQLCSAIGSSKLELKEDYSAKINEEEKVNVLCETAKDWVLSNITEYAHYKNSVEKLFSLPAGCLKVCSVDDLYSDDANFFCKYFKWGSDMLKNQVSVPPTQDNASQFPKTRNENKPVLSVSNDLIDVQIKNSTTSNALILTSEAESFKNEEVKTEAVKLETSSKNNPEAEPLSAGSATSKKSEQKPDNVNESVPAAQESTAVEPPAPSAQADKPVVISGPALKKEGHKPESPDTTLNKPDSNDLQKYEVDTEIKQLNNELEHKESAVLETPAQSKGKQPSDADEYQDSDEGKDGLSDIQGDDDGDDAMPGDGIKIDKLDEQKEEPRESQSLKTIVSGITGESVPGLYPSFGQDEFSEDDDDHFFSFFLTAVIMVVLIYVLYHNKNKVGKVFFGLILEGRQSGRRRNSRGHAYRRLDTLEQAMNTNSAAPPSKIIY